MGQGHIVALCPSECVRCASCGLVVLPTYNGAENIVEVLDQLRGAVPEADVLVVDDGSPDGTADLAEGWGRVNGQV